MSDFLSRNTTQIHDKKVHKGHWGIIFRSLVTVLIIAYLSLKVHWSELVAQLVKVDSSWLALSCFLFGLVYLLAALRWWFLLQVQGIHLPFRVVTALTFIGQFFNAFLLGAVGGDIIKAVYIHKYAPNHKTHATLSIIMDRVLGLLILICASLLVIPWQFEHSMRNGQINALIIGLLIIFGSCVVVGIIIVATPFSLAPPSIRSIWNKIPYRHIIEHVISGFRQHGIALNLTLASLVAGIAMTAVLVAASYCIGIGIGLTVTYIQMLVIMTGIICVISLPISIGGHGVREGVSVIMFSAFEVINVNQQLGSGQEPAILFSLLFFAIPLIWSVLGGIIYLIFRHNYDHTFLRDDE